ncbi:MAG: protein phosphatase 2C domain-containing protein [Pyrinomonadaceae bacterium]
MSTASPANNVLAASISDRGLSDKRPLNEDSYLSDAERGIFVVADGVGGADAGEVASQTAVDVLDDAFRTKINYGEDIEDLMELAIQRANSSIHQMASENPRFSMMATTVVALHLDGKRATIGHVGDSRLYRISPDGNLHRETEDHSVVEEEVRAGRMTPEQAANHPSKNVISRALGAENTVEPDMKTIEVDDGSAFLLCSDGITRHLPDKELCELLTSGRSPAQVCAEMKERCYQRGAEDNLTAVIVQVGAPAFASAAIDEERTVSHEELGETLEIPALAAAESGVKLTPASRIAFPGPVTQQPEVQPAIPATKSGGRFAVRFVVFLLFVGAAAAAFYGGMVYQRQQHFTNNASAQPSPTPAATLAVKRTAVDADPQKWTNESLPAQLSKEGIAKPTDSKDAEFLYLYGRALMHAGNHKDAMQAFELALANIRSDSQSNSLPMAAELKLADAAAALKLSKASPGSQEGQMANQKAIDLLDDVLETRTAKK